MAFLFAAAGACSAPADEPGTEAPSPPAGGAEPVAPTAPADALHSLGLFEGRFDHLTGEISVRPVTEGADMAPPMGLKADTLAEVPASSSGVPSGGGVVAFSPAGSSTVGCPGAGTRCGPVRLVNRTTPTNTLLRNAYAVVTSITPGWTLANSDGERAFTGFPASPVGYFYYEHLLASDRPTAATAPESGKVGFRGDRTWSFTQGSGAPADFKFTFHVYARRVTCTPTVAEESPSDAAYDPEVDRDCDGVPGVSRNKSLFVDPIHGDDATADGSILRPFRTPVAAAAQASSARDTVVIGAATYASTAARLDLSVFPVRNLVGAFDASNGFADRRLTGSSRIDPASTVLTFAPGAPNGYALHRSGASAPLYVEGLTLRATAGTAGTAYAVFNSGPSAASLTLRDVALEATGGAVGATAATGANGASGANGVQRSTASVSGPSCSATGGGSGGTGGGGGAGGGWFWGSGDPGQGGGQGLTGGGNGGSGGSGGNGSYYGGNGGNGAPGAAGANASPKSASLTASWFTSSGYDSASQIGNAGSAGKNGGGGGGGGGDGGYFSGTDEHGSSGGSGGCGGGGGSGGAAGGGAFGVFTNATSGSAALTIKGVVTATVSGGSGGRGGNGGNGGNGGIGAGAASDDGGMGGNGESGGKGGSGSGGNGGPAVCAAVRGASPVTTGATFTCTPTGGAGGAAATGGGNAGATGAAQTSFTF